MIDFYSDTKTRPSRAMREAMLDAAVGDVQKGEDPTTLALEEQVPICWAKKWRCFYRLEPCATKSLCVSGARTYRS